MSEDKDAIVGLRVAEARKAHDRGWVLTPLKGKKPFHKGWQRASAPPWPRVEEWARMGNVGLRTGATSGVVVVDDDTEDGSGVAELQLPPTVTVTTGSGKRHYYFRYPDGGLTNSPGNLPTGVDVRGDGGQVVYVGSIHPDTGRPYRFAEGLNPDEVPLADLPEDLLKTLRSPKRKKARAKARSKRRRDAPLDQTAREALEEAVSAIAGASKRSRNQTLNAEAFRVGRWVSAGVLSRPEVEEALGNAARTTGLEEAEISRTMESALSAASGESEANEEEGAKPSIIVQGGELPRIVRAAEDALLGASVQLYLRGNLVVRTMRAPAMTMRDVYRRAEGAMMVAAVDAPYLVEALTSVANWFQVSRGSLARIDCPERVARTYLARSGHWRLPYLLGVIENPTLRPDGSILAQPGYDPDTALLFEPGSTQFREIPENPTPEEARRALDTLLWVIKDFPWLEPCDRGAALAAILTALVRYSLRTAPLFAFRAPKMASGKSLLADVVAMTSTGRVCSVMSQGRDEDEDKKRMLAILMEGIGVACIDNIEREFGGASLCSVLTQEYWRERVLGKTGTATVPTATTWLATGNNIHFAGDITTRVVVCDLDPRCEKPEERVFDVDLYEHVPKHRGELVVAGLTILRAYHVAGRPDQSLSVFGRFEQWSEWVRSALVWLGEADPCEGRHRLHDYDPVGSQLRALIGAWHAELEGAACTAAEAIQACTSVEEVPASPLYQFLVAVAPGGGGKPDARRLGNYLAKYERRAEGGLRIERVGERQGSALWRVAEVPKSVARVS